MAISAVGILNLGEMGYNVALILKKHGVRVLTYLEGRSKRTMEYAAKAKAVNMPSLESIVEESDLIISLVMPSAALEVASSVAQAISRMGVEVLFADFNAISPMTSKTIGEIIAAAGGRYIDACIIGDAEKLETKTILYVSGPHAHELSTLNSLGFHVVPIGDEVGQASAFKMVYGGMSKGISCLAIELLATAYSLGLYDLLVEKLRYDFPDIVKFLERFVPGIPFRAVRREREMAEVIRVIQREGLVPQMTLACQNVHKMIRNLDMRSKYTSADEVGWNLKDVVYILLQELRHRPTGDPSSEL